MACQNLVEAVLCCSVKLGDNNKGGLFLMIGQESPSGWSFAKIDNFGAFWDIKRWAISLDSAGAVF